MLVVDVPASELAPHCVDFAEFCDRDKAKAKSQRATVTPYRDGSHTDWMAEHQVARAYAERLTLAADWQAAFDELRDWTAESFEGHGGSGTAWLIITGRPLRPVPSTAPKLSAEAAKAVVDGACTAPVTVPVVSVLPELQGGLGSTTVGLNSWVVTNRAREGRQRKREVRVELVRDSSFVLTANVTPIKQWREGTLPPGVSLIDTNVVEQACIDLEALVLQVLRTGRIDSAMRVQASVVSEGKLPIAYLRDWDAYGEDPPLLRLRPVTVEIPAGATEEQTKPAALELAAGILNQFGLNCRLPRYAS